MNKPLICLVANNPQLYEHASLLTNYLDGELVTFGSLSEITISAADLVLWNVHPYVEDDYDVLKKISSRVFRFAHLTHLRFTRLSGFLPRYPVLVAPPDVESVYELLIEKYHWHFPKAPE